MSDPRIKNLTPEEAVLGVQLRDLVEKLALEGSTIGRLLTAEDVWELAIEIFGVSESFFRSPHRTTKFRNPELIVGDTNVSGSSSEIGTIESRTIYHKQFFKENDPLIADFFQALRQVGIKLKKASAEQFLLNIEEINSALKTFVKTDHVQPVSCNSKLSGRSVSPTPLRSDLERSKRQLNSLAYYLRQANKKAPKSFLKKSQQKTQARKKNRQ